jgi:hypothetical protein
MEPIVGIFGSRASTESAARALRARGFEPDRIQMLLPGEVLPAAAENAAPSAGWSVPPRARRPVSERVRSWRACSSPASER